VPDTVEVAIVGAGAAGLAAAAELEDAGVRYVIVEARDRIGGRICTSRDPLWPGPVELGAEFVHGTPPVLRSLLDRSQLRTVKVEGEQRCYENGRLEECEDAEDEAGESLRRRPITSDRPFAEFLSSTRLSQSARRRVAGYIEGFNAADICKVSTLALKRQQEAEDAVHGDELFRVLDGYDAVPAYLCRRLNEKLHLSSPVRRVQWRPGEVEIRMDGWTVHARKAILTLPAGVLQSGAVEFEPEPCSFDKLAMGNVARVVLQVRKRFWESGRGLDSLSFVHAPGEAFPTWWTQYPVQAPVLTAWAGGPRAVALLDEGRVVERALESCAHIFGLSGTKLRKELISSHFHDWRTDPFALGAYTYVAVGGLKLIKRLASPFEDTLYFAGEATDTEGQWGTVHAALATGHRAAQQVLKSYKPMA
jgi:monoamine oxidase